MNTTTQPKWVDVLSALRACGEAMRWANNYDSLDAAWVACERGDWMLWLLGRVSGPPKSESRKALVLCACACARTALRYVRDGETRPLTAIETAEQWARGQNGVTLAQVRKASAAAYAAAASAAAASASDAAYAAYAAAASAAADAASAAARLTMLKSCAEIVRTHYPTAPSLS